MIFSIFLLIFSQFSFVETQDAPPAAGGGGSGGKVSGCFVATWAVTGGTFDPADYECGCTHVYVAFAKPDPATGQVQPFNETDKEAYKKIIEGIKKKNPDVKVLLSVGGGTVKDEDWKQVANKSPEFAKSAVEFAKANGFDGVDVDWEFQVPPERTAEDKQKFTKLMCDLKQEAKSKDMLVTASVMQLPSTVKSAYDGKALSECVDWVNVMTYDYNGAWSNTIGANSSIEDVKASLKAWEDVGMPKDKITGGVPFYGRGWKTAGPQQLGGQGTGPSDPPKAGGEAGVMAYTDTCKEEPQTYDEKTKSVTISTADKFVTTENPQSIEAKAKEISQEYKGVFAWEVSQDDTKGDKCGKGKSPLLKAMSKGAGAGGC
ncbi:glycosyl hydrolases family 18 domain-containing protein [Ditylenchus destructor]|uniref:Glycosyl hydrolases family 18 domain-containing protein n=1 Tax=Ditylenchus destructor TaxID=166010 RepID=A0AAD4MIX0_9BILA|nr:glycosyl hydrolases family 18 domain-containing protein [Ditylenchus destructor]